MSAVNARSRPTLAVIARDADVSVPTVSKVLNGREDVAAETRKRVTEVLHRSGYIRPGGHRRLGKPAALLDVVVSGLASSYAATIMRAIERTAGCAGMDIVVSSVLESTSQNHPAPGWVDRVTERGTGGVLGILAELTPKQRSLLDHHKVPVVLLDPVSLPSTRTHIVSATNHAGAQTATEHLIDLGHQRIAIITGRASHQGAQARLTGYLSTMAAAGLVVHDGYVRSGHFSEAEARRAMHELLDLPVPPTAVFACSDLMALGAHEAIQERGLRVPIDISLVGFDDVPELRWMRPALTTVRQPLAEMAAHGVHTLVRLAAGEPDEPQAVELPTSLTLRESTAPPRNSR